MGSFRHLVDDLELVEVHLNVRAFTWTSVRECLTLEMIDRVFISTYWEILFLAYFLRALLSTTYDHCPLLLSTTVHFGAKKSFKFESF